jgi:hypothetical protein
VLRSHYRGLTILGLTSVVLAIACRGGDRADPDFRAEVANPAYAKEGPRVLFDEAHNNHHRAGSTYRPFVKLLEADGYSVVRGKDQLTAKALQGIDVLVIPLALGRNERNDDDAFLPQEVQAIEKWVSDGGSLLLITDHYPFGDAVESLGERLGVVMAKGVVEDTANYDRSFDPSHIVYSRSNGGLVDHPITRGRTPSETIQRVLTFTGQGVSGPQSGVRFLSLTKTAVARPAEPVVERDGGDVRVHVQYGAPTPAESYAQGLALTHGRGRIVVLGDAAMLTAQLRRYDGRPFGMSTQGYDNRQLALNIMHWLTRLI